MYQPAARQTNRQNKVYKTRAYVTELKLTGYTAHTWARRLANR